MAQADDHRLARLIGVQIRHQRSIQLDVCRAQLEDVTEAREARPRVIDGKPGLRAEARDSRAEGRVVGDLGVLGHLEHDRPAGVLEDAQQRVVLGDQRRRDVHAQPRRRGQVHGCRLGGQQGGRLELGAKADGRGLAEADLRADAVSEARERLVADHGVRLEIDDLLEDGRKCPLLDDLPDLPIEHDAPRFDRRHRGR